MRVDVRKDQDVIIVDLDGKLVRNSGAPLLAEVINELLAGEWQSILLNLADVKTIDSSGIGELVAGLKLAERFGAKIKIVRPGDRVRSTLIRSQVLPLFELFEDETEAVASF